MLAVCSLLLSMQVRADELQPADTIVRALVLPQQRNVEVRPSIALQVRFEFNSSRLTPSGQAQLDELARALQSPQLSGKRYALKGYTDSKGRADYNLKLSQARADAVKRYLVTRYALPAQLLTSRGYGASSPLLAADTENAINRRVEVEAED
jgi:outer membrane protein OmpA-like peptidoglycan-associated protein